MGRMKLQRFALNAQRRNVLEPGKEIYTNINGKWGLFFENNHDIVLEIGCGRGEYTTGLANLFPSKNFIGVDTKGSRLWKGSSVAIEEGLDNVAFLRAQCQLLDFFFSPGEVSEIWITFPDPRHKDRDEHLRLTNLAFMKSYISLLKNEGTLHFKTDNRILFDYTLEVLGHPDLTIRNLKYTNDLYNSDLKANHFDIQTTFERQYLDEGVAINYLVFNK